MGATASRPELGYASQTHKHTKNASNRGTSAESLDGHTAETQLIEHFSLARPPSHGWELFLWWKRSSAG